MTLRYKLFGKIATLIRYRRVAVEGDELVLECPSAVKCRIYSESEKKSVTFEGAGSFDIPVSLVAGGVAVSLVTADGIVAQGTPLKLEIVGGSSYVVGGSFSQREDIERLNDALIYAVDVAESAMEKANAVSRLEERIAALEKRAYSGDIINF